MELIQHEKIPVVSIIMATYNRCHLIVESLNSIALQTFKNWECLIIDDGSIDNSSQVIKNFIEKDCRFKYLVRPDKYKKGLSGCRNFGLDQATGRYIIFFDDDDIVHPDNLKIVVSKLIETGAEFCRYEKRPFTGVFDEKKFDILESSLHSKFESKNLEDMITGKIPFASCTVLWDNKNFSSLRFNETLMYAEEWECYSRILAQGVSGISIKSILYYNRKHPESNTGKYWNNNSIQTSSKKEAAILVVKNLEARNILNSSLVKHFVRMSFSLKSYKLLNITLIHSKLSTINKLKYRLGYIIYPLIRPLFVLKAKIQTL